MVNNQEKEATVSADISIGAVIVLTSLIDTLAHIYYFCKETTLQEEEADENAKAIPIPLYFYHVKNFDIFYVST